MSVGCVEQNLGHFKIDWVNLLHFSLKIAYHYFQLKCSLPLVKKKNTHTPQTPSILPRVVIIAELRVVGLCDMYIVRLHVKHRLDLGIQPRYITSCQSIFGDSF